MSPQITVLIQRALWTALFGFFAWTAVFGVLMSFVLYQFYRPAPGDLGMCGSVLSGPTRLILNFGVPSAASAATGLVILARHGFGTMRSVAVAVGVAVTTFVALIAFRLW